MRKTLSIIGLAVLLTSCTKKYEVEKPTPLLSMEKMESIMMDCYLLDAALHVFETDTSSDLVAYGQQQWQQLLQTYEITTEVWQQNYRYYISKDNLRDTLMKHLSDHLTELEAAEEVNMKNRGKEIERDTKGSPAMPSFTELPTNATRGKTLKAK